MLKQEHGVLEDEPRAGLQVRLHIVRGTLIRVPWHKDPVSGEWYSGIEGPPIKLSAIWGALEVAAKIATVKT